MTDMQERRWNILTDELCTRIWETREEYRSENEDYRHYKEKREIERKIRDNAHEDLADALLDIMPYIRALSDEGLSAEAMIEQLRLALRGQNSILRGAWRFR